MSTTQELQTEQVFAVPKPKKSGRKRIKPKKSKLQKKKDDPFSSYWAKKCDTVFADIFHNYHVKKINEFGDMLRLDQVCAIGKLNLPQMDDCSGKIELTHIVRREVYSLRWDIMNALPCCSNHHKFSDICSSHTCPVVFDEMLRIYYPERYEYLIDYMRNRNRIITRKKELSYTFKEKYYELLKELDEYKNFRMFDKSNKFQASNDKLNHISKRG